VWFYCLRAYFTFYLSLIFPGSSWWLAGWLGVSSCVVGLDVITTAEHTTFFFPFFSFFFSFFFSVCGCAWLDGMSNGSSRLYLLSVETGDWTTGRYFFFSCENQKRTARPRIVRAAHLPFSSFLSRSSFPLSPPLLPFPPFPSLPCLPFSFLFLR
jgi:hypothetical protein